MHILLYGDKSLPNHHDKGIRLLSIVISISFGIIVIICVLVTRVYSLLCIHWLFYSTLCNGCRVETAFSSLSYCFSRKVE